jgi:hypothetical protein
MRKTPTDGKIAGAGYNRGQLTEALSNTFHFDDSIRLAGHELPPATEPGRPVEIAFHWQATVPIAEKHDVCSHS